MKLIEVPVFNDDGSVQATHVYSPEEAGRLLQFAVNFMLAIGSKAVVMQEPPQELDD